MLRQNVLEYIDALKDDLQDFIFQLDNDPPHITKLTQEWLENKRKAHGFIGMKWPTCENSWHV